MPVMEAHVEASHPTHGPARKPRKWRYLLAFAMFIGGLAGLVVIGASTNLAKTGQAKGFPRPSPASGGPASWFPLPAQFTFHVDHPATYHVYRCPRRDWSGVALYPLAVAVTGPTGQALRVEASHGPNYGGGISGDRVCTGVAKFEAAMTGDYRIAAKTEPYSEGEVTVGPGFPWWTEGWVAWMPGLILFAGGAAIIVVPIIRYRRQNKAPHPPIA